jgi:hypothetical protein
LKEIVMKRRKQLGSDFETLAHRFMSSAHQNFQRIRSRHSRTDSCSLIEHYTDVVSEATVAEAIAFEAGDRALATRANKLASTATHAQRGAVAACRRGVRVR